LEINKFKEKADKNKLVMKNEREHIQEEMLKIKEEEVKEKNEKRERKLNNRRFTCFQKLDEEED